MRERCFSLRNRERGPLPQTKAVALPSARIANKVRSYSFLWVPSQNGLLLLCLQPHSQTFFCSVISNFTGVNSLPLCEPSQNGWFFDRPQRHHQ
jgi:hypothetical protein